MVLSWQVLAVLTACFDAARILITKSVVKGRSALAVAFFLNVSIFICSFPFALKELPLQLGEDYYSLAAFTGALNTVAIFLYTKALKASDVSLSAPIISFVPLFLLITSPIVLQETASGVGVFGVCLIVLGAYTLQISKRGNGLFAPFKSLFSQKGPQYMLVVAGIYSITANFDKLGVLNSSPVFWVATISLIRSILLGLVYLSQRRKGAITLDKVLFLGCFLAGLSHAILLTCQMTAFQTGPVAYVVAVKRFSMVLATLYGCLIFKEDGLKERTFGTLIMFMGLVVVILLA